MNPWDELVTAALVGTERKPFTAPAVRGALGEVLERLDRSDAAGHLLGAAAAVCVYQRAGRRAKGVGSAVGACEGEDVAKCLELVARRLDAMTAGASAKLLPEWLGAIAARGWRVPEQYLPTLLQLGRQQAGLRKFIRPVIGKRGEWLARQNADWAWAVGVSEVGDAESVWGTGTREERVAVMKSLRANDPTRGRVLLESTWGQESPEDRGKFVELLGVGLSMEDEPFMENALDDKRKEVRSVAAELLSKLPESRLSRRMIERLDPLVNVIGTKRHPALEVKLPGEHDKGMARDGVEKKPPGGVGEKSWWLQQMVSSVLLAWWEKKTQMKAEELVPAVAGNDQREALWNGWTSAAVRQRNGEWAGALLSRWVAKPGEHGRGESWLGLMELVSSERLEEIVLPELKKAKKSLESLLGALVQATRAEWGTKLCAEVLVQLRERVGSNLPGDYPWTWKPVLAEFATRIPREMLGQAAEGWPTEGKGWEKWKETVEAFLGLVQFRKEMWEEISPTNLHESG